MKFVEWAGEEYRVKVAVTHAELKEFVTMALAGGVVGGVGYALIAKALGIALSWPAAVFATITGAVIGAMSTTLHIRVYKKNGATRIKLKAD